MNIIIAVDDNYIEHAKTMLYSLADNTPNTILDIYLIERSVSPSKLESLQKFARKRCNGNLYDLKIADDLFKNVPQKDRISIETYFRLLAFLILPKSLSRALWLDSDLIIKSNIVDFYNQNIQGVCAAVCDEKDQKHHMRLSIDEGHKYFNAGVILFNLDEMRKNFQEKDIFNCIEKHKDHLDLMDQDVLNILLENKVRYCDAVKYNNGAFGFSILDHSKMKELKNSAIIIHYWGAMKPWNWKGANWADCYWWRYELKRGRIFQAIAYRSRNSFVKAGILLREVYYIVKAQMTKLGKR